jgi:hypothetical protein
MRARIVGVSAAILVPILRLSDNAVSLRLLNMQLISLEQFPNCHMYGELALHTAAGTENLASFAGPGVRCKSASAGRMRMKRNAQ